MSLTNQSAPLKKMLSLCEKLKLNINDDIVKFCIAAVLMCGKRHDINYEHALLSAYKSPSIILMNALQGTREYQLFLKALNFEIKQYVNHSPSF
ncbi:hypothetical protein [Photobacterium sp. J15]|uniref:hypothetical protein n=1 Tax=Photobacterium sp. J15 TaxID=265901 RepID=UPI0007E47057|nr:hypothetical protein [Photobacterium sp. J15]